MSSFKVTNYFINTVTERVKKNKNKAMSNDNN